MKAVRVEEAGLRLVEVWPAREDDRDSHEKVDELGEPELPWSERGYEKETAGFPLQLGVHLLCSASEAQAHGIWCRTPGAGRSLLRQRSMFGFLVSALSGGRITKKGRN